MKQSKRPLRLVNADLREQVAKLEAAVEQANMETRKFKNAEEGQRAQLAAAVGLKVFGSAPVPGYSKSFSRTEEVTPSFPEILTFIGRQIQLAELSERFLKVERIDELVQYAEAQSERASMILREVEEKVQRANDKCR